MKSPNNYIRIIYIMLKIWRFRLTAMLSIVLLEGIFPASAFAMSVPNKSPYDPHIQRVSYRAGDVVKLDAVVGRVTVIVFNEDEIAQELPSGYSIAWEFRKSRNMVSIKPKELNADTNLIVKTDKRLYVFDLTLKPYNDNTGAYLLTFDYPESIAEEKIIKTQAQLNEVIANFPPVKNYEYSMEIGLDSDEIAPTEAYDDGRFTYLRFPNNREIPAVFAISGTGQEYTVNSHMDGDKLVIHQLSGAFMLRAAKQVVGVFNEAYDASGVAPQNGTTVPGLKRSIRSPVSISDAK